MSKTTHHHRPSAAGDSNPTNGQCLLCGTTTGGTGLLCGRCVALPVPRR
jgi:hypothetical protein